MIGYGVEYATQESEFDGSSNLVLDYPYNVNYASVKFVTSGISDDDIMTSLIIRIARRFGYPLRYGEHCLPAHVSLWDAIRIISTSKGVMHKFCIVEGVPTVQVIEKLKKDPFLQGEITDPPAEGELLPDTYCFRYPTTRQDIIDQAKKAMQEFLEKAWAEKSPDCRLKTLQEVVTLASIVEKETQVEYAEVAGLYLNRLRIKMRLQADPTVIYAITKGQKFPRALTRDDLKFDNPYNTYMYDGLPPGPITNPSKNSILGVLHPKKSNWLFMVAENSSTQHVFAETYEEHLQNCARIRKERQARGRR